MTRVGKHAEACSALAREEIQQGFRRQTGADQFGRMVTRFFGDFVGRILRSAVDRELSKHVGPGRSIKNIEGSVEFSNRLDRYAHESAKIVQDFGRDWYAKRLWHAGEAVSQSDAEAFVGVALKKLRRELKLAGAPS